MPTYVMLLNYTEQGVSTIESSPNRIKRAHEVVAELGGEIHSFHLTFGQYDGVAVVEFPDDETAAEYALTLGKAGNARTETLRAFSEAEFADIVTDIA